MVTDKELEQEIENRIKVVESQANPDYIDGIEASKKFCRDFDDKLNILKGELKGRQEVRKELKEKINNIIIDLTDEMGRISYYILQRELDKIFEGKQDAKN